MRVVFPLYTAMAVCSTHAVYCLQLSLPSPIYELTPLSCPLPVVRAGHTRKLSNIGTFDHKGSLEASNTVVPVTMHGLGWVAIFLDIHNSVLCSYPQIGHI